MKGLWLWLLSHIEIDGAVNLSHLQSKLSTPTLFVDVVDFYFSLFELLVAIHLKRTNKMRFAVEKKKISILTTLQRNNPIWWEHLEWRLKILYHVCNLLWNWFLSYGCFFFSGLLFYSHISLLFFFFSLFSLQIQAKQYHLLNWLWRMQVF